MNVAEYVEQLRHDGDRLAEVASSTDPDAPVPTCPDWQLRDLVRHVGGVHRWATGFVLGSGQQPPEGDHGARSGRFSSETSEPMSPLRHRGGCRKAIDVSDVRYEMLGDEGRRPRLTP